MVFNIGNSLGCRAQTKGNGLKTLLLVEGSSTMILLMGMQFQTLRTMLPGPVEQATTAALSLLIRV